MATPQEDEERARQVLADIRLPEELSKIEMVVSPDWTGDPSLQLSFHIKPGVPLPAETITMLTRFMMSVADRILRSGVSLFPYVSLDEAA